MDLMETFMAFDGYLRFVVLNVLCASLSALSVLSAWVIYLMIGRDIS